MTSPGLSFGPCTGDLPRRLGADPALLPVTPRRPLRSAVRVGDRILRSVLYGFPHVGGKGRLKESIRVFVHEPREKVGVLRECFEDRLLRKFDFRMGCPRESVAHSLV